MDKDTFKLHFDTDTQIPCMKKEKDEQTKIHRETDSEVQTGFMPQALDNNGRLHKLFPACSPENYISHLNSKCDALWEHQEGKS